MDKPLRTNDLETWNPLLQSGDRQPAEEVGQESWQQPQQVSD